jgi:hypothetical protein
MTRRARRFVVIESPQPIVAVVPAPILVVRRLADGREMARFPATAHLTARKMAGCWRGRVEVVPGEASVPGDRARNSGETPWAS